MNGPSGPAPRPGGVTFLAVLVIVNGLVNLVSGISLMFRHGDPGLIADTGWSSSELLWFGVGISVAGLVYLLVARGLLHGNGLARFLVALDALIQLAGGVIILVGSSGSSRWTGLVLLVIPIIILMLMYSRRANEFFRTN